MKFHLKYVNKSTNSSKKQGYYLPKNSKKWPIIKRDLSVMTSKKYQKKGNMLKITLIIGQKSQKGLDNNAPFELKIVQFYVIQGKKQTKITVIKGPKSKKKTRYHGRKITKCFKKTS